MNPSRLTWKIISWLPDQIYNANHLIFMGCGISTLGASPSFWIRHQTIWATAPKLWHGPHYSGVGKVVHVEPGGFLASLPGLLQAQSWRFLWVYLLASWCRSEGLKLKDTIHPVLHTFRAPNPIPGKRNLRGGHLDKVRQNTCVFEERQEIEEERINELGVYIWWS